jgi:hypothetical protein
MCICFFFIFIFGSFIFFFLLFSTIFSLRTGTKVNLGNLHDRVPSGDDTAVEFLTYQVDGDVLAHHADHG